MNKPLIFLVFGLMLIGFVSGMTVDKKVLNEFNSGKEKVRVIIERNQNYNNIGITSGSGKKIGQVDKVSAYISKQELEDLESDPAISQVRMNFPLNVFLEESVSITGANSTWGLQSEGFNLSGVSQSVCILDTGINSTHPDFAGKILAEKCYCTVSDSGSGGCCPDNTTEDNSAIDDDGHGTHVAGIVGASGAINGIATGVGLVIVKIMNGTGEGNSLDLENGIQWCLDNAATYNISVITASLGGADNFTDSDQVACDNLAPVLTSKINTALSNNVSVTIAAGNNGWTDAISWPACISSAIPIGATKKDNSLVYNRNSFVKIFGIGYDINSTCLVGDLGYTNGYCLKSGTSMATPMVAGAIAIIDEFLRLTGRTMTPPEVENILQDTGENVSELGNNYSRINVYDAILSLDIDAPNVTLISPINNKINLTNNQTFVCNATDWQLANMTLRIWNSSNALYYNVTNNLTGIVNQTNFTLTNMSEDAYHWNCLSTDIEGNSAYASANFTLVIGGVSTTLISPSTGNYTKINDTNFSCNISSDTHHELSNVTFYLWNGSGNLTYNLTSLISGFTNTTTFNYTFVTEGNYSWNCLGINNGTNESWGSSNFTIIYDITNPNISLLSEATTTSGATITWTTNESTNSSISMSAGSWTNSSNYSTSHSIAVSGLSSSTAYTYTAISCDRAGNCRNSSDNFTTGTVVSSSGRGGGSTSSAGGISGPMTYKVAAADILAGYTKKLRANEKINFSLFNFKDERHLLTVKNISTDHVNLTIESDPIRLMLVIGQIEKLNLTSENYYDTSIKLENITDGKAEITIKLISEPIEKIVEPIVTKATTEEEVVKKNPWAIEMVSLDVLLGVTVIVLIVIAIDLFEKQSEKLKRRMTIKKKR